MRPVVTIGIPTFNRPELLPRALECVIAQDYPDLEVVIADNGSDPETPEIVEEFTKRLPGLRYVRHERNIGALANFRFLLDAASGKYFMWLADDDEISENYVSSLVEMLEQNPDAAAAVGHWLLMENERSGRVMQTANFPEASPLRRALRFIWRTDDAFFYALHRRSVLAEATFPGYWWPNQGILLNWPYVYLLDVVLRGRVLLPPDSSVQFKNHDYTSKDHVIVPRTLPTILRHVYRRLNVHALYWQKCARRLPLVAMPAVMATSTAALTRELSGGFFRKLGRALHVRNGAPVLAVSSPEEQR